MTHDLHKLTLWLSTRRVISLINQHFYNFTADMGQTRQTGIRQTGVKYVMWPFWHIYLASIDVYKKTKTRFKENTVTTLSSPYTLRQKIW